MKNIKKLSSILLVIALVFSMGTSAFAAQYSLVNIETNDEYDFQTWTYDEDIVVDTTYNGDKYTLEVNEKQYMVNQIIDKMTNEEKSLEDAVAELEPYVGDELTVESVSAITETTVTVTLAEVPTEAPTLEDFQVTGATTTAVAKGATDDVYVLTVNSLAGTSGTITVNGKSMDYNFETVAKAEVEDIEFVDYRHIQVTYSTVVDEATATNPANYYFEIVEGDTAYGALPTLQDSNQLNKIETDYTASAWFDSEDGKGILSSTVDGKTVVDIYLPEDARFTNIGDDMDAAEGNSTINAAQDPIADDEQTLTINLAGTTGQKLLVKNTNVNVAVRNVKTANGVRSIDTFVKAIRILDESNPSLVGKYHSDTEFSDFVELLSDGSDNVTLKFDEPVFDAHGLNTGTEDRNVKVYINGKLAATTDGKGGPGENVGLPGILDFDMSTNATYDTASKATLNVSAAAAAVNETFNAGDVLSVRIIGITDLAGNIQVPSDITFNVTVKDPAVTPPTQSELPEVLGVEQVADNIFRVEFNGADATGEFVLFNSDGEDGDIGETTKLNIPLSTAVTVDGETKYYSYVTIDSALDEDETDTTDDPATDDEVLAYDGQDYINRQIKVLNPWFVDTAGSTYKAKGANKDLGTVEIAKDIYAPQVIEPTGDVAYDAATVTGAQLVLNVEDVVPESWTNDYANPVSALLYDYNNNVLGDLDRNTVVAAGDDAALAPNAQYLPIKVSYIDADGATHSALISNVGLPDNTVEATDPNDDGLGVAGISYDAATKELTIDLWDESNNDGWVTLLDKDQELVKGVYYTVEIPKGFFADPALEDVDNGVVQTTSADFEAVVSPNINQPQEDLAAVAPTDGYTSAPDTFEVLHVSDARNAVKGYSSAAQEISYGVEEEPEDPTTSEDAVPQTSKELIDYDADKNELVVEFTGAIKVDTLKDPANYELNGKTLAEWELTSDDITYKVDTDSNGNIVAKYAVFEVPQDSVPADGDVQFIVEGVTNPDGGMMTEVITQVALLDNTRPISIEEVVSGQRQIIMTFDEPLYFREGANEFTAAKNFEVTFNDSVVTVLKATVVDGERTVTLDLGSDIPDTGDITIQVIEDANGNINIIDESQNKNPLNSDEIYTIER